MDDATFVSSPQICDPRMDPVHYAMYCALQLDKSGWKTRLAAITGDQGTDVIANRAAKVLVLQCKLSGSPVGDDAGQKVMTAQQSQEADFAAVVSNRTFTDSANELAQASNVQLLHYEQLPLLYGDT